MNLLKNAANHEQAPANQQRSKNTKKNWRCVLAAECGKLSVSNSSRRGGGVVEIRADSTVGGGRGETYTGPDMMAVMYRGAGGYMGGRVAGSGSTSAGSRRTR